MNNKLMSSAIARHFLRNEKYITVIAQNKKANV